LITFDEKGLIKANSDARVQLLSELIFQYSVYHTQKKVVLIV